MTINKILRKQIELIKPDPYITNKLREDTKNFVNEVKKEIIIQGIDADVFVGGSFAKGTLLKKYDYDIDVFVRFNWRYDNISDILEKVLNKVGRVSGYEIMRLHGSRDYFRLYVNGRGNYFEIIPVTKIKKPSEEKNVTDLSYFHVPYVKRKIKGLENELRLAKTFCHANGIYGAESYIRGFSGYALELLIIHYKSFTKMLRELSRVKIGERLIIDIEKKYRTKNEVFFEMNESKLHSPVILIDPTYKERNALASLGHETFFRFQKVASDFLKTPSLSFFVEKHIDYNELKTSAKKKKLELVHIKIYTDKQAGDIAGTKLHKFFLFFKEELNRYFKIVQCHFEYHDNRNADIYYLVKSRKEVIRIGPPLHMKKHVNRFKKEHRNTYEKNKFVHAKIRITFGAEEFANVWKKQRANKRTMRDMSIIRMKTG